MAAVAGSSTTPSAPTTTAPSTGRERETLAYYAQSAGAGGEGGEDVYGVRLGAWQCDCAAFAAAAYARSPSASASAETSQRQAAGTTGAESVREARDRIGRRKVYFGGVSALMMEEGMPPVCKHLLACALAEGVGGWFGCGGVKRGEGWDGGGGGEGGRKGVREVEVGGEGMSEVLAGWAGSAASGVGLGV